MDFQKPKADYFDQLPDPILLLIFNEMKDAKSLCRCLLVCKRFGCLIPEVDTIFLKISPRNPTPISCGKELQEGELGEASVKPSQRNLLKCFLSKLVKPFQHFFVQRMLKMKSKPSSDCEFSNNLPVDSLKTFQAIKSLHVELPGHGEGPADVDSCSCGTASTFLKWKAEFGRELKSCVILGGTSCNVIANDQESDVDPEKQGQQGSNYFTDDELKMRVVWTISCLIGASARHYLFQQLVSEHKSIRDVVITDRSKQGKLCMGKEQIEELRGSVNLGTKLEMLERTPVPALKMKLWYMPELKLPLPGSSGPGTSVVMKGVTMVVVRPVGGGEGAVSDRDLVMAAFDGEGEERVFGEAVKKMLKKRRAYTLEMNAF